MVVCVCVWGGSFRGRCCVGLKVEVRPRSLDPRASRTSGEPGGAEAWGGGEAWRRERWQVVGVQQFSVSSRPRAHPGGGAAAASGPVR